MAGELWHFLKGHIDAHKLMRDPDFMPNNERRDSPDDPNVIGMYMGKEWEWVAPDSPYVKPVDEEWPHTLPHRNND